ncbi:MAG: hypothetical protein JSS63_11270 [Bacteroidetes bacterium]|nr:hypothetical protein [Bacteroidota bacterium]MBX7046269.1 hypothetical protein [Ignavibacteria bacterium]
MKNILFIFAAFLLIYAGCKSDDSNPTTPTTGEVEMASVSYDSVYSIFAGSSVTQTRNFGSSALNFTDRDSTRLSFSYKGSSNGNDTLFYITDASNARLYTLVDATPTSSYRTVNVTVPSIKVNALFYYTIRARTTGSNLPYMVIKDFKMYKR